MAAGTILTRCAEFAMVVILGHRAGPADPRLCLCSSPGFAPAPAQQRLKHRDASHKPVSGPPHGLMRSDG